MVNLVQEAMNRAHRESGGSGFQFNMQYMDKKNIFTIRFDYKD